jgi:hypothetical protein
MFDTSAMNKFVKESDSAPLFAGVLSGYIVRIAGMTLEEFAATPELAIRRSLFHICRRLLAADNSTVIDTPVDILESLIKKHNSDPAKFNWTAVPIKAERLELGVYDDALIENDEMVKEQRTAVLSTQKELEKLYEHQRQEIEESVQRGEQRPASFNEHLALIQAPGGAFWRFVGEYYETDAKAHVEESKLRHFMDTCPPFRAFFLALALKWYDKCVRPLRTPSTFKIKRNDLMFAVYLPYCDQFITADEGQEDALKQVAVAAQISVQVRSYRDFSSSFDPIQKP